MRRLVILALLAVTIAPSLSAQTKTAPPKAPSPWAERDTLSLVRGTVTDAAGNPLDSIEVYVMTSGQSARTDAAGHYRIANLIQGPTRLRARRLGWVPVDTAVSLAPHENLTMNFRMLNRAPRLDTIRVTASQDDCAPRAFNGFQCRRKAGVGVFRDSAELAALAPEYQADLFDGIPGLRRERHGVKATEGWRCVSYLINGHPPTMYDRASAKMGDYWKDIVGIEFYAHGNDTPKWYKIYAFAKNKGAPCSLIVLWTKGAK